jgi:hypothetical protein
MQHREATIAISRRAGICGVLAALACGPSGCSDEGSSSNRVEVNVVYDPRIDFSSYRSFAFRSDAEADGVLLSDLEAELRRDLAQVNALLEAELRDIGLEQVAADDAELLAFSLARTNGARYLTWTCVAGGWGGYWYWDYYYDPCAWLEPVYVDVDSTTLMVGLLDPEREQVVFAGFVRGIGRGAGPDSRDRDIASGVARVLARYPARPASPLDGGVAVDAGGSPSRATL